jgi:hypothetical protein
LRNFSPNHTSSSSWSKPIESGVEDRHSGPQVGGGLDAHHADGPALEVLRALDGAVVLDHVLGLEPLLAGRFQADPRHDLDVEALGPPEDHREPRRGAAVQLARQVRLEPLGVGLEQRELEPVLLSLVRREVGPRDHQPHLLLGGEAVAEAAARASAATRAIASRPRCMGRVTTVSFPARLPGG